jgi:hypothetical protein
MQAKGDDQTERDHAELVHAIKRGRVGAAG